MLASFFNTAVARAIAHVPRPLVQKISRRYIAGASIAEAVVRVQALNAQGFTATIDVLGEVTRDLAQAQQTADEYQGVLDAIHHHGLRANISVKPSALGLLLNAQQCETHIAALATAARRHGNFVRMDMEDLQCTQAEIDLLQRLRANGHGNTGLALQAYLKRTYRDIEPLLGRHNNLRLCKGIYVEDKAHLVEGARHDRQAINSHFLHHVERCLDTGTFVAVATHDEALIEQVIAAARRRGNGAPSSGLEFQMLLGVCEPLRDRLRDRGYPVRIYVPYGQDWHGYSIRRLKENPQLAGYLLKAALMG
ncbi:proline dehydrogenase family protein [Acidovorax sp. Root219]|uniref:proline dehydrogenase family protein n=1 Tax=Acidovorax sp. Root219 TaxID=1736493 RepID=UPI00070EB131|nr:proline dehydrogenase family protein [Acidovorax sp. Root219]KRC31110.1 L-proline dehydrogenase [Acidovorax sp. Root219]